METAEVLYRKLMTAPNEETGVDRIQADRAAAKLEVIAEITDLGVDLMKQAADDTRLDHASRLASVSGGCFAEAIRLVRAKYAAQAGGGR